MTSVVSGAVRIVKLAVYINKDHILKENPSRELHSYSLKRNLLGRAAVLVVISFLLFILIYSSVIQVDMFAKPKITMTCTKGTPSLSARLAGAVFSEVCCQSVPGAEVYCVNCDYDANGNSVGDCTRYYPKTVQTGPIGPQPPSTGTALPPSGNHTGTVTTRPSHLGTVLPPSNSTSTPGKTIIFNPIRNATNAAPGNTSNGTLPPGGGGPLPAQTITKEHNPASPNVFSPAGNTTTNASSNTNSTGH
jgi:hypothetical protein